MRHGAVLCCGAWLPMNIPWGREWGSVLPGTSGLVHRDPCGEKAATSGGKEGKNANKIKGGKKRQQSANLHIIWLIYFANLILRPAAPASAKQTEWMRKKSDTTSSGSFFSALRVIIYVFQNALLHVRHSHCMFGNLHSNWHDSL